MYFQVLGHLLNHLGHFPMATGPARLHTDVQEHHDITTVEMDELNSEIFNAPNVQVVFHITILMQNDS